MSQSSRTFNQTANWFPNLSGLNLPRALTNAIQQAYLLIYSLRDAIQGTTSATAATTLGAAQVAYATGDYELTHTATVIPGCTLTLSAAGMYLVTGIFNVAIVNNTTSGGNDANFPMVAEAVFNGVVQHQQLMLQGPDQMQAGVSGQWLFTGATAGEVISLSAFKIAGAGVSHTTPGTLISALRVSA